MRFCRLIIWMSLRPELGRGIGAWNRGKRRQQEWVGWVGDESINKIAEIVQHVKEL